MQVQYSYHLSSWLFNITIGPSDIHPYVNRGGFDSCRNATYWSFSNFLIYVNLLMCRSSRSSRHSSELSFTINESLELNTMYEYGQQGRAAVAASAASQRRSRPRRRDGNTVHGMVIYGTVIHGTAARGTKNILFLRWSKMSLYLIQLFGNAKIMKVPTTVHFVLLICKSVCAKKKQNIMLNPVAFCFIFSSICLTLRIF